MGAISGAGTAYPFGSPEFTTVFSWVRVTWFFVLCSVVCRSLFVLLSFFFCPLCCLSFFDLWFWLPLWFLQTLITFLQTSLTKLTSHFESYMMHAFSNWWKIWFRACNEFLFHSWKNETMYCNITLEISTKIN